MVNSTRFPVGFRSTDEFLCSRTSLDLLNAGFEIAPHNLLSDGNIELIGELYQRNFEFFNYALTPH